MGRNTLTSSSSPSILLTAPQLAETRQKPAAGGGTANGQGTVAEPQKRKAENRLVEGLGVENNSTCPCLGVYTENILF